VGGASWADGNNGLNGINRVRIHDNVLSAAAVLNNYNFEKNEFVLKPVPPQPRVGWRSPADGRVLEFGEVASPDTSSRLVHVKNTGTGDLTIVSNSITGPDGSRYTFQPVPLPAPAVGDYPTTGTLAPNAEIKYNVVFTPTAATETSATLTIDFGTTLGLGLVGLRGNVARIHVAPAPLGNDNTGDGSAGAPYGSLGKAMAVASLGSVIEMEAGTYGPSSAPQLANATRSLRIVGDGAVTILCPQSTIEDGFEFESQQIPNPNIPPPPPGVVFPLPDPLAQVYDWNASTVSFSNITIDAASNATDGGDEPLRLSGSGVFDVNFDRCKLLNNWGTAALQADLQGADNRLTGGFSPYTRLTANNTIFRGDGPDEDHDSIRLEAQEVVAVLDICDLRSGGADNLTIGSNKYRAAVTLTNCQLGSLTPSDNGRWPARCIQVNPGPASVPGSQVTLDNCTLANWTDSGIASFAVASSVVATGTIFAGGVGAGNNLPDWGVFWSDPAVAFPVRAATFTNCVFSGRVQRHLNGVAGLDLRVTDSSLTGQRGAAIQVTTNTDAEPTTISVVGSVIDTGTTTAVDSNPAAVMQINYNGNSGANATRVIVKRNTIRGQYTGATTPSLIQRGGAVQTFRVFQEDIGNNVIEGSDFPIWITTTNADSTVNPNVINNTIVGLSDAASSIALRSNRSTLVPVIRNNLVLGYPTLRNTAAATESNNHTSTADPLVILPHPYAAPAAPGMSDYHPRAGSALINAVVTTVTSFNLDRDGVDRDTLAPWDIGAFESNPGVNPVIHWNWFD
jgi:hypothetical protein